MIALNVEVVGALGVRERRRIDEDEVVFAAIMLQPADDVGLDQQMRRAR